VAREVRKARNGGGGGGFARDPETAKQDAEAARLRAQGLTYRQIADTMGLSGKAVAYASVQRCLADTLGPPAEELRTLEGERLDDMTRRLHEIIVAEHIVIQHGKIVRDKDGEPLKDHDPVLKAITVLLRVSESRRKLFGLDVATKADVTIHQVDTDDLALVQIIRDAQARNDIAETQLKAIPGTVVREDDEG
jgi:hypothetical protein